jgi:hypothetical protein
MKIEEFYDYQQRLIKLNEKYYYVTKEFIVEEEVFEGVIKGVVQFKFKSDADYFAIMNIPILTAKDISDRYFGAIAIINLQTIVKQKLSQGFKINRNV